MKSSKPTTKDAAKKSVFITFRVSPEMYAAIRLWAKDESMVSVLRQMVRERMEQETIVDQIMNSKQEKK